jgi:hypothetical protein
MSFAFGVAHEQVAECVRISVGQNSDASGNSYEFRYGMIHAGG